MKSIQNIFALLALTFFISPDLRSSKIYYSSGFDEFFNEMLESMQNNMSNIRQISNVFSYGPNKKERKIIKQAQKKLEKIKPSITKDDKNNVLVTFPIDNIEKKSIDITLEDNVLNGVIPTNFGKVEFFISPSHIKVTREIEIQKQDKQNKQDNQDNFNKQDQKNKQNNQNKKAEDQKKQEQAQAQAQVKSSQYFGSLESIVKHLPLAVDLTTVESETKDNKLIIKLAPKKYAKVKISHN